MIIKSFFRRLSTKIYFLLLLVSFILLCCFTIVVNYLDLLVENAYSNSTEILVNDDDNIYDLLKNDNRLKNVHKISLVDLGDNEGKYYLSMRQLDNKVLIECDDSLEGINTVIYYNNGFFESDYEKYLDKEVDFLFNEKDWTLHVADIVSISGETRFKVSREIYDNFNDDYFIANIRNSDFTYALIDEYEGSVLLQNESSDSFIKREKLEDIIKKLKLACVVVSIIFIIVIIVINRNIKYDLKRCKNLEMKLGFTDRQIMFNSFKRLSVLHLLVFLSSFLIFIIIILYFRYKLHILISFSNLLLLGFLFVFLIVLDVLLVIFNN